MFNEIIESKRGYTYSIEDLYQAFKKRLLEEHKEIIERQLNDMYEEHNNE